MIVEEDTIMEEVLAWLVLPLETDVDGVPDPEFKAIDLTTMCLSV